MKRASRSPSWVPVVVVCLVAAAVDVAHAETMDAANRRGADLMNRGYIAKAIEAFKKAAEIALKSEGPTSVNLCRVNNSLANAYLRDSQFVLAEKLYRESYEGMLAAFNAGRGRVDADELGWALQNWANYYFTLGQYTRAEEKIQEALKIFEDHGLDDSASSARYNLAGTYAERKAYQKAMDEYDRVLKYRKERFGTGDTRFSNALDGPGVVYLKVHEFEKAEPFFRRSLEVAEARLGRDKATGAMDNLAFTLRGLGRYDEARELYERLHSLAEASGNSTWVSAVRERLATLNAYQGRWKEAVELCDEVRHFSVNTTSRTCLGLADTELLSFLQIVSDGDDSVSIGWARHDDRGMAEMAAGWSINDRGFLYEAMAERQLLIRDDRLTGQHDLFEQLIATRRQYSALLHAGPKDGDKAAFNAELQRLGREESDLAHRFGLAAGRPPLQREYIEVSHLRENLDPDTVLIHFALTQLHDFSFKGGPHGPPAEPTYFAWVIPPAGRGEVRMIRIGTAAEVDAAIKKIAGNFGEIDANREGFNQEFGKLRQDKPSKEQEQKRLSELQTSFLAREAALEKSYRQTDAQDLSKLLLHPLLAEAGSYRRWILCPDSEIWMQPWNALVLPNGRYFIEEHTLTHVVTPRELTSGSGTKRAKGPPVVISSPNYDLGVTGDQDRWWDVHQLNGFGPEWVGKFLPNLEKFAHQRAQLITGDAATESTIKRVSSPQVLFLATHGMFGKVEPKYFPPGFGLFTESPLVRCQLVFAGCNRRHAPDESSDDGVLYGSEVLGCDLRGTDLVMLTACQTAQGDVHAGQSAAGMRQAFQLAGAREVIATLWSVDQAASKQLVLDFMSFLAHGFPPVEALHEAELLWLKPPKRTHPFYWAPFTITGR